VLIRTAGLFFSAYATLMLDVWYWRLTAAAAIASADASMGLPTLAAASFERSSSALQLVVGHLGTVGVDARPLLTSVEAGAGSDTTGTKVPGGGEPSGPAGAGAADEVTGGGASDRTHAIASERAQLIPELLAPATRQLLEAVQTVWMVCPCLVHSVRGMNSHVRDLAYYNRTRGIGGSSLTDGSDDSEVWLENRELDREIHESQLISSAREINDGTYGRVYAGLWGKKLVAIKIFKQSMTDRRGEATVTHAGSSPETPFRVESHTLA